MLFQVLIQVQQNQRIQSTLPNHLNNFKSRNFKGSFRKSYRNSFRESPELKPLKKEGSAHHLLFKNSDLAEHPFTISPFKVTEENPEIRNKYYENLGDRIIHTKIEFQANPLKYFTRKDYDKILKRKGIDQNPFLNFQLQSIISI